MNTRRFLHTKHAIEEMGICFHSIHPCVGETGPSFLYTVGMTQLGAPELICFGIPDKYIYPVVMHMYQEIKEGKRKKVVGRDDDLWNFPTYFDEPDAIKIQDYATATFEYCEAMGLTPRFRQLVWPDKRGFYPFEAQFDPEMKKAQPYLGSRKRRDADHEPSLGLN